jgi:hypothetical protein
MAGSTTPALLALDQLVAAHPNDPGLLARRARVRAATGAWKEAVADLKSAAAHGDHSFTTACDLAAARHLAGDTSPADEIRPLAGRAATAAEAQAAARLLLIRPDTDRDTLSLARRLADKAVAAAPEDPRALATLTLVELRAGNARAASDAVNRLTRIPARPGAGRGSREPAFAQPLRALVLAANGRQSEARYDLTIVPLKLAGPPDPGVAELADDALTRQLFEEAHKAIPAEPTPR